MNGFSYQCIVYSTCAAQYISNTATLSVLALPGVAIPPSDFIGCPGSDASFTVAAFGAGIAYQWQENTGWQ